MIEPGDTLDAMLARAGMDADTRLDVALALGAEYDLRLLRLGNRLTVAWRLDGTPTAVTLAVENGVRIEVMLEETMASRTLMPETYSVTDAEELTIDESISTSLDRAGMPARFAVDLSEMLGGNVDFRRDLQGGASGLMFYEGRSS